MKILLTITVLLSLVACGKKVDNDIVDTPAKVAKLTSVCTAKGLSSKIDQPWLNIGDTDIRVFCLDENTNLLYNPSNLK